MSKEDLNQIIETYAINNPDVDAATIESLKKGTADISAYAEMFSSVQTGLAGDGYYTMQQAIIEYTNNLPPEQIPVFIAEMGEAVRSDITLHNALDQAISEISDPQKKVIAQYSFEFYSDENHSVSTEIDYSDPKAFSEIMGDKPKEDQQEFLDWLKESNPQEFEKLNQGLVEYKASLLVLPEELAEEMIKIANNTSLSSNNRGTEINYLIGEATYSGNDEQKADQQEMANIVGAYIAKLDDEGKLKGNEETILALANGTASPEEYARMFIATNGYGNILNRIDAEPSIAYYLNNAGLSKEDIATFVGAIAPNEGIDFQDAINKIDDPITKALAQFNYTYFKDNPSTASVAGDRVILRAPDLIDYSNAELFKETFETDPKGAQVLLKFLIENDPEAAKKLAENLGNGYLEKLYSDLHPNDNYLYTRSEKGPIEPDTLIEIITGMQFPQAQAEVPVVGDSVAADSIVGDSVAADSIVGDSVVGDSVVGDSIVGDSIVGDSIVGDSVAGDSVAGDSVAETQTDQKLTKADLEAMREAYPLVGVFLDRSGVEIPAEGFTIEEFTAQINTFANGEGRDDLGLSVNSNYEFEAGISADGDHLTNVHLMEVDANATLAPTAGAGDAGLDKDVGVGVQ